jgi:hypothetical protein
MDERISRKTQRRTCPEAAALGTIPLVACPKDVTMFRDAVKTTGNEGRLFVKDLIELVHEAL